MKKILIIITLFTFSILQAFDTTIPILHLPDYYNAEKKQAFLEQFDSAIKTVGFFALTGLNVDMKILDNAYAESKQFFSLDFQEKMKYLGSSGQRGFVPSESAKDEQIFDFKEFYHIGRELPIADLQRLHLQENIWINHSLTFRSTMLTLFNVFDQFKEIIGEFFATILEKEKGFINAMTKEGDCLMRMIHYPANPPKDSIWAAAHTDINFFTIVLPATAQGLQVQNQDGEWIDVIIPDSSFLVNCGDMLENLSNGYCKSATHRVKDPGLGNERYAIVYFVHPRSDDRLDPLSTCIEKTGGKRFYPNITRLELLAERLIDLNLASDDLIKFFISSGAIEKLREVDRFSPKAEQALIDKGYL